MQEEPYQGYRLPKIDKIGKLEDGRDAVDVFNLYQGVEVDLPVIKRIKGNDGNTYPRKMDELQYLVEFSDGTIKEVCADLIAEHMFTDVDSEGRHYRITNEIMGNEKK